ncbi:MAG TPA: hypothetical protein VI461_14580 [Chitinophagaceae bacterium]|nr:hypothetical protein [Chitinophagaceae bacterium]
MAPEIAFDALSGLPKGSVILDPMAGSGTVLRTISELGYKGIGFDIDPLAVLMSKAWTTKMNEKNFVRKTEKILNKVKKIKAKSVNLSWIDKDMATRDFIKFWFAQKQITQLRKLSYLLNKETGIYSSLLKIAFSRLIITKSKGASLATDISHSRPHKVKDENDFDVISEFRLSCSRVAKIMAEMKAEGKVQVRLGDARKLSRIKNSSIDFIITSPPYLNALDYMRGHKLSLVWLGHKIGDLSAIRSYSVGAEKAPDSAKNFELAKAITKGLKEIHNLPQRKINIIYRYALDMHDLMRETARVLKPGCSATFVIGNSSTEGVYIKNTTIVTEAARKFGLRVVKRKERIIPDSKRYLPPPSSGISVLNQRMRTEAVITFAKN